MTKAKVVSFDLDGTLFDTNFVDSVWFEGIPQLYSIKNRVSFNKARELVKEEYNKVGKEKLEWYVLRYWIGKFGLWVDEKELLKKFENRISLYPEVPSILEYLRQKGFRLVIITNARREFAEFELAKVNIKDYFERVFSSTSDFGLVKKGANLYLQVCNILKVHPQEILHVGDDRDSDFIAPRKIGMPALYLDRKGKEKGKLVLHGLEELTKKLEY